MSAMLPRSSVMPMMSALHVSKKSVRKFLRFTDLREFMFHMMNLIFPPC